MAIQVGAEAPDFELESSELVDGKPGKKIRLSEYRGKKNVVLAFYPLDFSPVCSKENECFREDLSDLEKSGGQGTQLLGISVDSKWAHFAFAKQMGLKYPLLADFWAEDELPGAGLWLPAAVLHLRDPQRWFPFNEEARAALATLEDGGPADPPAERYRLFNEACAWLRGAFRRG